MPELTPVGLQAKGPDLGTLSSIYGIQQQRQALQTGAQELQQKTLATQQQQGVQDFFSSFDPSAHVAADGTTDLDSALQDPAFKASGNAKPAIMQAILDIKNKQLQAKTSLASLDANVLGNLQQQVGALKTDPDVIADTVDPKTGINAGRAKVKELLSTFSQLGPDQARIAQIEGQSLLGVKPGMLSHALNSAQLMAQSAAEQRGAVTPSASPLQTRQGVQFVNTNPNAPQPVGSPMGAPVQNATAPSNILGPNGQILQIAPGGAPGSGITAPGGGGQPPPQSKLPPLARPAPNAPAADQQNYKARIEAAGQEYQGVSSAAADPMNGVQATRYRNQTILDLIPHADTGPGRALLNKAASALPGSSGDAYQDLEHYTAQNSAALASKMGVPSTNLGAQTAAAAAGNVERNPGALAEITKTNDALNTAFDLYNRGLAKVTNNGSDMSRAASYKQAFGQNLDINAIRWADAHRRGDKEEIAALAKQGPKAIAAWNQKLGTLKALADKGDLP
jgi:hypothetical protein